MRYPYFKRAFRSFANAGNVIPSGAVNFSLLPRRPRLILTAAQSDDPRDSRVCSEREIFLFLRNGQK